MTDIVVEHFKSIVEPDLFFDGKRYTVKGEVSEEEYPNVYEGLTEDEMKEGHHINYYTFRKFFELLSQFKEPTVLETGSSAWGVNSSTLFDRFINKYGGKFFTVDINQFTTQKVKSQLSPLSEAHNGDSVSFIKSFKGKVDAVYLDSWDIDWLDYTPSAEHGRKEMEAVLEKLNDKAIILIDDTPASPFFLPYRGDTHTSVKDLYEITNTMPGKGMYAEEVLNAHPEFKYTKVLHMYAVIYIVERV